MLILFNTDQKTFIHGNCIKKAVTKYLNLVLKIIGFYNKFPCNRLSKIN